MHLHVAPLGAPCLPSGPRRTRLAALVLTAALAAAGCATKQPAARLLALPSPAVAAGTGAATAGVQAPGGAAGPAADAAAPAAPGTAMALRRLQVARIDVPEYWQSRSVRFRTAGQDVGQWPHVFWAERVEVGMSRNLTAELAGHLPAGWALCTAGCGPAQPQALRLVVSLLVLDYEREPRTLKALARWSFVGAGPAHEHSAPLAITSPSDSPEGQAASVALLLRELAGQVARSLPPPAPAAVPGTMGEGSTADRGKTGAALPASARPARASAR